MTPSLEPNGLEHPTAPSQPTRLDMAAEIAICSRTGPYPSPEGWRAGRRFTGVAILVLHLAGADPRPDAAAQPQPATATSAAGFVGAPACASCHQEIHDTWKGGRHSKMLQPATRRQRQGRLLESAASRCTASAIPLRATNGDYFITSSLTGKEQEHRVQYTLGSRRIQHYLTTIDNGRIIVLPPTWDVQRRDGSHNMDIVRPDENHQQPVQQWNKDCVGCHVSQQENNYRPATGEYATDWRTSAPRASGAMGRAARTSHATRRADGARPRTARPSSGRRASIRRRAA